MLFNHLSVLLLLGVLCLFECTTKINAGTCGVNNNLVFHETILDSFISDYVWIIDSNEGSNSGDDSVVFVKTDLNTLWRSDDAGVSWANQMDKLVGATDGIFDIQKTVNPDMLFFLGFENSTWTTSDRGKTYSRHQIPSFFETIFPHPSDANWAAAASAGFSGVDIYFTNDFGSTWHKKISNVWDFAWSIPGVGLPNTSYYYSSTTSPNPLYYNSGVVGGSDDKLVFPGCSGFLFAHDLVFVVEKSGGLVVSANGGVTFTNVTFPSNDQEEENLYSILEVKSHMAFIGVAHSQQGLSNIYVSGFGGAKYTLSIRDIKRDSQSNEVSFAPSKNLNTVYFANQGNNDVTTEQLIRTVITFDNGGHWSPLTLPYDSQGKIQQKCPEDAPGCGLHLHEVRVRVAGAKASESPWGPILTDVNAVGLILATGNVGEGLSQNVEDVKTYLSNDTGLTWSEIRNGSYEYEFADYGAIIAMADSFHETNEILYSWNEGLTVLSCLLPESFHVDEIIGDPRRNGQKLSVLGSREVNNTVVGVVVTLDFSNMHERVCSHPDDYFYWTPPSQKDSCYLGMRITYTRRKREAECYNPDSYEPVVVDDVCACTKADYECDLCYEVDEKGDCIYVCGSTPNPPPTQCNGTYYASQGYRLVTGNECDVTKGVNLLPRQVPCPTPTPTTMPTIPATTTPVTPTSTRPPIKPTPTSAPAPAPKPPKKKLTPGEVTAIVFSCLFFVVIVVLFASAKGRGYINTAWIALNRRIRGGNSSETRPLFGF